MRGVVLLRPVISGDSMTLLHAQLQARTLGCKAPEELSTAYPEWVGCNFIPENLHPKSFRGYIGHNTNVWAAASRAGIKARAHLVAPAAHRVQVLPRSFWGICSTYR